MQVFSGFRIQSVPCPRSALLSARSRKNTWKRIFCSTDCILFWRLLMFLCALQNASPSDTVCVIKKRYLEKETFRVETAFSFVTANVPAGRGEAVSECFLVYPANCPHDRWMTHTYQLNNCPSEQKLFCFCFWAWRLGARRRGLLSNVHVFSVAQNASEGG